MKKSIRGIGAVLAVALGLSFALGAPRQAHAACASGVVTDPVDGNPCSLRDILTTTAFSPVTFDPSITTINLTLGEIFIARNVTITGPGSGALTVDAGGSSRIFRIQGGRTVNISGVTLNNGFSGLGAAVRNFGTLTLSGVVVSNNWSCGDGGGVYNEDGASLTITGSTFTGNIACDDGSAIKNDPGGVVTISGSTFVGNTVNNNGTIWNNAGTVTITGSTFSGNTGARATVVGTRAGGVLTISGSCFLNNTSTNGFDVLNSINMPGSLSADNNWWDIATGPNTGGETTNVTIGSFQTSSACASSADVCADGRYNCRHGDDIAIVYGNRDSSGQPALHIYCVSVAGVGTLDLIITEADLAAVPDHPSHNTEVFSVGPGNSHCRYEVSFWVLTTGEYQIMIGPKIDGYVTVMIFRGMPPSGIYYQDSNVLFP